jgi:hypothetical protein
MHEKLKANTRTECESFDEHRRQNKKAEIRILKKNNNFLYSGIFRSAFLAF